MSFRLADLKKTVRKGKDGHAVTASRLEGRQAAFQIEFVLREFEAHLGQPRRTLDPELLLDFVGDTRLGRGLLATLSQWYRMRPRTFTELLAVRYPGESWRPRLETYGITGPVELRAWLYADVNLPGPGYLDPENANFYWQSQARLLGLRPEEIRRLCAIDRPEEAVLVRTGPRPTAQDVMAAYNARAHTTLLRSAEEVHLRCAARSSLLEQAARAWADGLDVEWQVAGDSVRLAGRADVLGCWTRHGRRLERVALELLALPDLQAREVRGELAVTGRRCRFRWEGDTLALLGAGAGAPFSDRVPAQVDELAAALRRERERAGTGPEWRIRRPAHLIGVAGAACLPQLELRRGDLPLSLRLGESSEDHLAPFTGKTPVGLVTLPTADDEPLAFHFPGESPLHCSPGAALPALAARFDHWQAALAAQPERRRLQPAA
jgi:hypothetical protein